MNGLALGILSALGSLILFGSRRYALLGMTAGILYLTQGLALSVGGLTLYPFRVLLLIAFARILIRREWFQFRFNALDRTVVVLYLYSVSVFLIRSNEGQIFQIGTAVDALLSYFVFRAFVRTLEDLKWILIVLAVLLLPYVPLVWFESTQFHNPFAAIGGVELANGGDLWIREGRLRAAGSFMHPSLLGTLGGSFLPLYVGLWVTRTKRMVALLGIALCLAVVGASNSGGPMLCVAAGAIGWLLWPLRAQMKGVRIFLAAGIAMLALIMKAPIWYLLAHMSAVTGGDGYHRAVLLDVAFKNLASWALAGMPLSETSAWLPYTNTTTGFVDMTNTFLQFGVTAGLGAVFLVIAMLSVSFIGLGRKMQTLRGQLSPGARVEPLYWGLGVMLNVHIVNWFGITYWDQSNAVWFLHLAMIGSLAFADPAVHGASPRLQVIR